MSEDLGDVILTQLAKKAALAEELEQLREENRILNIRLSGMSKRLSREKAQYLKKLEKFRLQRNAAVSERDELRKRFSSSNKVHLIKGEI